MPYIHFTDEQKLRASSVDLVEFLRRQGEKLIRSGPEYRMTSDHSVTVRGSEWYDHAAQRGGGPISFMQTFYNLDYPEAVTRLLDGEQITMCGSKSEEPPKKEFALPNANRDMRRVYAYLLKRRLLDREIVSAFARAGLLYESCEQIKGREYHNAVFVGKDENGVARHAHKRSVNDQGRTHRIDVEGSDPRYSFHWTGTSDRLYVFEAPIDLLSMLTLYPKQWEQHSFVALCGTSHHAMLWMLEQNPGIQSVCLCLDHDAAGIEANGRLSEILQQHGNYKVGIVQSKYKDWNEDIKALRGLPAQEAEEHPQLVVAPEVCSRVSHRTVASRLGYWEKDVPKLIDHFQRCLKEGRVEKAVECMEQASAQVLGLYGMMLGHLGEPHSKENLMEDLRRCILPHQNCSSLKTRVNELTSEFQYLQAKISTPGVLSEEDKRGLAKDFLDLAVAFAKVPVKYNADILIQQQKQSLEQQQEPTVPKQEMG